MDDCICMNDYIDLGAHTVGSKDNNNILISFASFKSDGSSASAKTKVKTENFASHVKRYPEPQVHKYKENHRCM